MSSRYRLTANTFVDKALHDARHHMYGRSTFQELGRQLDATAALNGWILIGYRLEWSRFVRLDPDDPDSGILVEYRVSQNARDA